jgi:quercetin dioxygenase-like cupin family protein
MKKLLLVAVLGGAAVLTAVALGTPSQGQSSSIVALGALQTDVAFNTGLTMSSDGVPWGDRKYDADKLPEFLAGLRSAGVTNLGLWLNLHPAVSAKFGMMPIGLLHAPEVVTQTATFAPGAASGWHSHPGYLTGTVVSGQVVRYGTDCSTETFTPGQTFYETAVKAFTLKNTSTTDPAVVSVTFVVPGGTPTTALRVDKAQPAGCTQ